MQHRYQRQATLGRAQPAGLRLNLHPGWARPLPNTTSILPLLPLSQMQVMRYQLYGQMNLKLLLLSA